MRQGMPRERILKLAARPQGFGVTWRISDAKLMSRCKRMVREGLLTYGARLPGGGASTFHRADPPARPAASCDSSSSATTEATTC